VSDHRIDVDLPEPPIWSFRGFAVHVLTVTVGFLIALGLNSLVSLYEQHRTASQARSYFRLEIAENRPRIANDLRENQKEQKAFSAIIAFLKQRKAGGHPQPPGQINLKTTSVALSHAAWDTGLASQALTYMPFEQTAVLAQLYAVQNEFAEVERDALRTSYDMAAFSDPDAFTGAELPRTLNTLQRSYAYLTSIAQIERKLLAQYDETDRILAR
jgi:hypothetical protein